MWTRFLLTLPLLMLAQCTATSGTHHAAVTTPSATSVEATPAPPAPPSAEQIEFFNRALDQA